MKIKIVAEIGCNHNGDVNLAKQMVVAAKECGADAVKFQTFKSEALISRYAPKAEYQKETTGADDSQLDMIKALELSHEDFIEIRDYADSLGLEMFSTPFDFESIDFLESICQRVWKIPSGEITNLPYLRKIGSSMTADREIILSSGMATVGEIKNCIDVLVDAGTAPSQIILLHCNTEYPTPDIDVNLSAINDLKANFPGVQFGFSDHSVGSVAAIGAATMGIVLIEKHFTLDKNLPGPDHKASATPEEFREICEAVRRIEDMFGVGKKVVTASEQKNIAIARKSIVAAVKIKKGEIFTEENITCKRPGNGISPMCWDDILGKVAEQDFEEDQLIVADGFDWFDKTE